MKLIELFEDFRKTPSKSDFYDTVDRLEKTKPKTGLTKIGSPSKYGRVYNLPKEQNSILKVARHPSSDVNKDGYFQFIQQAIELDNPYFPQVDEITKKEVSPEGEPFFTVKMEKYHQLNTLSPLEFQSMWSRMFNRPVEDREMVQLMHQHIPPAARGKSQRWAMTLAKFIERSVETNEYLKRIEDPQLVEAIKFLRSLWKQGYKLDIHDENIMVRRTPYGPHLVITDPFSEIRQPT